MGIIYRSFDQCLLFVFHIFPVGDLCWMACKIRVLKGVGRSVFAYECALEETTVGNARTWGKSEIHGIEQCKAMGLARLGSVLLSWSCLVWWSVNCSGGKIMVTANSVSNYRPPLLGNTRAILKWTSSISVFKSSYCSSAVGGWVVC